MKKKKMNNLVLSKKVISKLGNVQAIKGGNSVDCTTNDPTCLEPSGVSACLPCMEDPTEGCIPGTGTVHCFLTLACAPSAFC